MKQQDEEESTGEKHITKHVRRGELSYKNGYDQQDPEPKEWQLMPELPTAEELMAKEAPELPSNISPGQDTTKQEYLRIQYLLYRHEGLEHLRRAIAAYASGGESWKRQAFVYTQVRCRGYLFARSGAACRVSFSTETSDVKVLWDTLDSDRLTAGTLIALSPVNDKFRRVCFVAVVAARPLAGLLHDGEDEPPMIDIYWADHSTAQIDPAEEMVMIEARSGFFETVRHPMRGLQNAALYESRFDKYIIDGHKSDNLAEWFEAEDIHPALPPTSDTFDESQKAAFERMTSRELAIVQGPPGTGKTFTSLVALDSLVKAFESQPSFEEEVPPIIVAAQTNHALDQLLSGCVKYNDATIARIGGRSKDESMEERTLYNIRRNAQGITSSGALRNAEKSRYGHIKQFKELVKVAFPTELISAKELKVHGIISESQYDSLNNDEWESLSTPSSSSAMSRAANRRQRYPQGASQGNSEKEKSLLEDWLVGFVERDTTCHYVPPTGQLEPTMPLAARDAQADQIRNDQRAEEDEKEQLKGVFCSIELNYTGSIARGTGGVTWTTKAVRLLRDYDDLYEIKPSQRGLVYRYLRQQLVAQLSQEASKIFERHQKACELVKMEKWKDDAKVLQQENIRVVGCTTTGLTKYRDLLAALKPRVLLVEEAAETREPHVTSALFPTLQQLILVGDHQQLVPHVDVRELGHEPYNLHVSLFERLVNLGLPYSQLRVQRRMIPAIGKLLQTFYPDVTDHEIVKDPSHRPPVPGLKNNMWWFQHCWQEQRNDTFSFSNLEEAKMIIGFTQYLVQNGVKPEQITILTFYSGQLDLLRDLLHMNDWFATYHPEKDWTEVVRTVDGFQGEENDVILLSVVRSRQSHEPANAGFVANENRAVVALSRAKRGLYVFGNSTNLLQSSEQSYETWGKVLKVFRETVGKVLSVQCQNHGKVTEITSAEDWDRISGGGCQEVCNRTCPNGHPCELPCHIIDQASLYCRQPCAKILPCGHKCATLCYELCRCPEKCDAPKLEKKMGVQLPVRTRTAAPIATATKQATEVRQEAKQHPKQAVGQKRVQHQSQSSGASHLTSDDLLATGIYRSRFCVDGGGTAGDTSRPIIRETFRQTSTDEDGNRVVENVSVRTHERETVQNEAEEEDLIDLRDEVEVQKSSELLIDFGE